MLIQFIVRRKEVEIKVGMWGLIFLIILGITTSYAYVFNRGNGGIFIKWPSNSSSAQFYLNTTNNDGLSSSEVKSIVNSAASEWNSESPFSISVIETSDTNRTNQNDISFTSADSWYSDASIVGVTQVVYDSETGEISETDIHINDYSHNLTDSVSDTLYLGNVVAHEFGHAIGLDHSQVNKATMYFQNQKGQSTLSDDDGAGAFSLYGTINNKGSISGKIIGGPDLTSVFGAHVSAISQTTGQVAAGTISESDGTFIISGLDLDATYYIYVEPSKALSTIPFYYQVRRADFCENGQDYQGSFFQGCLNRDEGLPQGINLSSSNKSPYIGSVTIRCGIDVPTEYMMNKPSQTNALNLFQESGTTAYIGESMVGYFSPSEVLANTEDVFSVDLTNVNLSSYANTNLNDLYLEVKTVHQTLFSKLKLQVDIQNSVGATIAINPASLITYSSEDNLPMLDTITRVPLSNLSSLNDFKIVVTPSDNSLDSLSNSLVMSLFSSLPRQPKQWLLVVIITFISISCSRSCYWDLFRSVG